MKIIFLSILLFLISCSGGGGGGDTAKIEGGNVTPGNITDEQVAQEFIHQSNQTLPPELKFTDDDNVIIQSELDLTADEISSLNQLK